MSSGPSLPQGEIKEVQINWKIFISVLSHGICPGKADATRGDSCNAGGRDIGTRPDYGVSGVSLEAFAGNLRLGGQVDSKRVKCVSAGIFSEWMRWAILESCVKRKLVVLQSCVVCRWHSSGVVASESLRTAGTSV